MMNKIQLDSEVIDMEHSSSDPGLISRKIWQKLFNIHRTYNGDLNDMDSMLCDLKIIKTYVKAAQKTGIPAKFYWTGCFGSYTDIQLYPSGTGISTEVEYDPVHHKFSVDCKHWQ